MKMVSRLIIAIIGVGYYVGCSDVKFEKDYSVNPCQNSGQSCVVENGREKYEINKTASGGVVDIVFMNDNSGSMSFEQTKMAQRFSTFLQILDSRSVDYRIGMITSDVSAGTSGAFPKNGDLLTFGNGKTYITPADSNRQQLFTQAIQRQETIKCENWLRANPTNNTSSSTYQQGYATNCPMSGDERGIYALNMFLDKSSGFVRSNAALAVVILADEDERSSDYNRSEGYKLSTYDLPQNFLDRARAKFGSKVITTHSIIVNPGNVNDASAAAAAIASGTYSYDYYGGAVLNPQASSFFTGLDQACLTQQSQQINYGYANALKGSYGFQYALLAKMTSGIVGDICASDYGNQLANIGQEIVEQVSSIQLACANPEELIVNISQAGVSYWLEGSVLKLSTALNPGAKVTGSYFCQPL